MPSKTKEQKKGADSINYGYATQKAQEFIKQYEVGWLPVDPFELMDKLNIQYKSIGELVLETGLDRKTLIDEVIFGEDGLIFYEPNTNSTKIIFNEQIEPFERIRWTIMHEIGHAYLGHLSSKKTSILKWTLRKKKYKKYEQEANIFAEEVLAPKFVLYLIGAHSISEIMEICGIPKPAAESRANDISELINDKTKIHDSMLFTIGPYLYFLMKEKEFYRLDHLYLVKELAFQNDEKDKRAAELVIANKELAFQNDEKADRAAEFIIEHQSRLFEEKMARLDRLNLVGQMAAGIAHEIRNPMTTVRGYLQLWGAKPWHAAKKPTFDLMISELDQANAIITEFLSLAQTKPTELKSQNLNDILNKLYPLLEADTFTQNKQISFIPGEIPNLELNGNEITQLVLNLTRNGLDAMGDRGCLNIRSYVEDGKVVLSIADEGCGIPPENLRKVGTPFFTTKDSGTGLGLAICYKIAESHNAKIDIQSSSKGTTFFIFFPFLME